MKHKIHSFFLIIIVLLSSCRQFDDSHDLNIAASRNSDIKINDFLKQEANIFENAPSASINALAFSLYSQIKDTINPVFSPFSIAMALNMTYVGASNETEALMKEKLHFGDNTLASHKSYGEFANLLVEKARNSEHTSFLNSNMLWPQEGMKILDSFRQTLAEAFWVKITPLDFSNNLKGAIKTINNTVAEQTKDEIKELLKELPPATRLILTNATYFKSLWAEPFDINNTSEREFKKADGTQLKTKFMSFKKDLLYTEDDSQQILKLNYKGDEFAAIIILPKEGKLSLVESQLNRASSLLDHLRKNEVQVYLPKFSQRLSISLKTALTKLGLGNLFSADADFSKISPSQLFIDDVIHETVVTVDEKGTTAAAATAVIMVEKALAKAILFDANHPFIFQIIHVPTKTILFMGRIDVPLAQK